MNHKLVLTEAVRARLACYIVNIFAFSAASGFTIHPLMIQSPVFDWNIFIVSLKGYEQRFYKRPIFTEVENWISLHKNKLSQPGYYIGGWKDNDIYFLDVSIAINGRVAALKTAHINQQLAIYHPFSGQSDYLPKAA